MAVIAPALGIIDIVAAAMRVIVSLLVLTLTPTWYQSDYYSFYSCHSHLFGCC